MPSLTADRIRERLRYDADTGQFWWRCGIQRRAGTPHETTGYIVIFVDKRVYGAHRLAWLYVHGEWPPEYIDHRDGNPHNNAISNLRLASNSLNQANRKAYARSLPKGVTLHKQTGKYQAAIKVSGKSHHLGLHTNPSDAHKAYVEAARRFFGEFARAE